MFARLWLFFSILRWTNNSSLFSAKYIQNLAFSIEIVQYIFALNNRKSSRGQPTSYICTSLYVLFEQVACWADWGLHLPLSNLVEPAWLFLRNQIDQEVKGAHHPPSQPCPKSGRLFSCKKRLGKSLTQEVDNANTKISDSYWQRVFYFMVPRIQPQHQKVVSRREKKT